MSSVNDIYENLCALAPPELQLDFDNSGFLLGHRDAEVKNVLLALDITEAVISEAIDMNAELIISHHPLIFSPLRDVSDCGSGKKALRMAENHIAAICMHTNLDIAPGGVNDVLMELLGAKAESTLDKDGCGRVGELEDEMSLFCFMHRCKKKLKAKGLRYYDAGNQVKRIAVMGGSGASAIEDAVKQGCDTYVTADIKYHQFQQAQDLGINLIDAGHFSTENPVIPILAQRLRAAFPDVNFSVSKKHRSLIDFI